MSNQLREFEDHMHAVTEHAKLVAMNHVAQHTREMTRKSVQMQVVEIHEAARTAMGANLAAGLSGKGARPYSAGRHHLPVRWHGNGSPSLLDSAKLDHLHLTL
jgi:hypothetical protein